MLTENQIIELQFWKIPFSELTISNQIGFGGNAEVFEGRWRGTNYFQFFPSFLGFPVAIKMISSLLTKEASHPQAVPGQLKQLRNVMLREIYVWSHLHCPYLCQFLGYFDEGKNLGIVSELLFTDIRSLYASRPLSLPEQVKIFSGILFYLSFSSSRCH